MIRKLTWWLVLALPLAIITGCGSADVEVPENPTPPPGTDPGTASMPSQDADG